MQKHRSTDRDRERGQSKTARESESGRGGRDNREGGGRRQVKKKARWRRDRDTHGQQQTKAETQRGSDGSGERVKEMRERKPTSLKVCPVAVTWVQAALQIVSAEARTRQTHSSHHIHIHILI